MAQENQGFYVRQGLGLSGLPLTCTCRKMFCMYPHWPLPCWLGSTQVSTCLPELHHLLLLTAVATQASTQLCSWHKAPPPSASVTATAPHPFSRQPSLQHPARQQHCQDPPCGTRRSAAAAAATLRVRHGDVRQVQLLLCSDQGWRCDL